MAVESQWPAGARAPKIEDGTDKTQWTVMVFMGAATVEGSASLDDAAAADLAEMEAVGSGNGLKIFVQVHGNGVPQRAQIGVKSHSDVPEDQRELAKGQALANFIASSLEASQHEATNPNHYSMLVLWGHAYDFAFGRSKTASGMIDALDFAELSDVLERLQARFGGPAARKLDILGFDACDLATVEMACQLQPFANYLLGSQIGIPIPGWPYDRVFDRLKEPKGQRTMGPAELGSYIVRRFCESYSAPRPVSLSLLDLKRAQELFARADVLAQVLASAIEDPDTRDRIAYLFIRSQTDDDRPYVDIADLCLSLVRESGDVRVMEAARALGDFLISPHVPLVGESLEGSGRPFVLEHGRNAGGTARLNGISIYAPHVAPIIDFEAARHLYENFDFAQQTRWSDLVHALARLS